MNYTGATCRSCGAPVVWALTDNARRIPVDRDSVEGGNLYVVPGDGHNIRVRYLRQGDPPNEQAKYVSHFATCPNAKEHRRE